MKHKNKNKQVKNLKAKMQTLTKKKIIKRKTEIC